VNDVLYDASNVTGPLGVVERAELGRGFVETGNLAHVRIERPPRANKCHEREPYRLEDAAGTLTLVPNLVEASISVWTRPTRDVEVGTAPRPLAKEEHVWGGFARYLRLYPSCLFS